MSSEYTIETRRRSRSKTPFLRSQIEQEQYTAEEDNHGQPPQRQKKSKAPIVETIVEEVTSSSSPIKQQQPQVAHQRQYESKQVQRLKAKTSDYSSEDTSSESSERKDAQSSIANINSSGSSNVSTTATSRTTTTTTVVTKSNRLSIAAMDGGTRAATSTPKGGGSAAGSINQQHLAESFAVQFGADDVGGANASHRYTEITHNALNSRREHEASHNSSSSSKRSANSSLSRVFGDSFDINTADLSKYLAYMEYKKMGEYWNNTPKTDYTYSKSSVHRRYLAPGIVAMPNMSRPNIENYRRNRAHNVYTSEHVKATQHYQTGRGSKYAANRRETERLLYDSGDELDYNRHYYGAQQGVQQRSWFMRVITTIVTTITTLTGFGAKDDALAGSGRARGSVSASSGGFGDVGLGVGVGDDYITRMSHLDVASHQRGFFGTIGHGVSSGVRNVFHYIGAGISSVLAVDTWLLQSRNADGKGKKRVLLLLLLLLPLLLLAAAWYFLPETERAAYVQHAEALMPVSLLASMRAAGVSLQGKWQQLPIGEYVDRAYTWTTTSLTWAPSDRAAPAPAPAVDTHIHIEQLQKALTADEYEQLLKHVNGYVQQLVDLKLQEQRQRISPEQMQVIVRVMRENLESYAREKRDTQHAPPLELNLDAVSEADVQRLAQRVQQQLLVATRNWQQQTSSGGDPAPARLSAEQLAEIRQLIVEHAATTETHNHAYYTMLTERLDLDALLARVLGAPQLARFIDVRIGDVVESKIAGLRLAQQQQEGSGEGATQQHLLNKLSSEVAFIKLALSDKQSENAELQRSIVKLQGSQEDLLQRLQTHELATDSRFSGLLADIERKLASLKDEHFAALNQQIRLSLIEILGFKQTTASGAQLEDGDLQQWVANMFVAKDYLEQQLMALNNRTNERIRDEIDRSAVVLMRDINVRLKREILTIVEARQHESSAQLKGHLSAALSEEEVRRIVKSVLAVYDADKTGLVDFALESAGGQILSTRCTESYQTKTAQLSVFGIPLWYPTNTPRIAISPNVQPGECWAFQGFPGFLVLKLNSPVYITGFTLEHIPKSLSPSGRIESAPGNFTVWGLEHEKDYEPVLFGEYEYANSDVALQYFRVQNENIKRPYDIVELRIESNHGHPQYTCLYRFRVHGKPPAA